MILQALVKEYENLAQKGLVSKPGWSQAKVSYAIDLNADGSIKVIYSLQTEDQRGKKIVMVPALLYVPEMVTRSSGVAANFLCDNAKYMLGIDTDGTNDRVKDCFQAAKEKHIALLKDVDNSMAKAICSFFETWNPENAKDNGCVQDKWEELNEGGNLIFCMGMDYAQDDSDIKAAWENSIEANGEEQTGICLVTGERTEIARIHRGIKGVPGAQSSGAALVSFNAPAFESYGKEQSYNAPVGKYAEFAYTTALNYLLSKRENTFSLGDSMIVFWAETGEKKCEDLFCISINPQEDNQEQLQKVFDNLKAMRPIDLDDITIDLTQQFYILCLAPNAARLSVRFFYQNSFGTILKNIEAHYKRMDVVRPSWANDRKFLGIYRMLQETVNMKSKEKKPVANMAASVLQAVLSGNRYPASLYTDTLIRIRSEQGNVTYGRAAIIKAFLIKNYQWKEGEECMESNEVSNETLDILGRLFSVLESVQKEANPEINTTIRDRYFNSACATPASVFPVLIKLKNSHIKKLERKKGCGAKNFYEKLITELMAKINGFPQSLSLEEQGKFMLGYYHQKYEKKEDK
jgi:CRISPR-associated protein Csd1